MAAERSIAAVVAYGLQPVGFGTAQVLSLYAVNADTLETADMARALAAAAGAALLAWGVLIPFCGARRAAMVASVFGRQDFSKVSGLMVPAALPIQIAAVPIAGLLFDRTQDFGAAFSAFLFVFPVAALMLYFIRDPAQAPPAPAQT